jgi:hypothetical protein
MAKYTLICEETYDNSKITVEFEAVTIIDVLNHTENFIRSSGYQYMKGCLDFVEDLDEQFMFDDAFDESQVDDNVELPKVEKCPVCMIDKDIMQRHDCFDKQCPKETW